MYPAKDQISLLTYDQLKTWYKSIKPTLPNTLEGCDKYYANVPKSIDTYFHSIDYEIERLGLHNIKNSAVAIAAKADLLELYSDLQIKENWNVKVPIEMRPEHGFI